MTNVFMKSSGETSMRDRVYPCKIMCILLYAADTTPGILRMSPGIFNIDYAMFRKEMKLPSRVRLQLYVHILRDMGLLTIIVTSKSHAVVKLSPSNGWNERND